MMKRTLLLNSMLIICSLQLLSAQEIQLPRLSPKASVSYTIGYTNVEINYSAPAVKERAIWGNVVPYDKVWRAGANEATTMEFSTDVNMEGQTLKAGKYSVFIIPTETEWEVIFNKKADQWGTNTYNEAEDAIRFITTPKLNESTVERLMYTIHEHDKKMDAGYIKLSWEKMRLYMRFRVNTMEQSYANIISAIDKSTEERKWIVYAQGAEYLLNVDGDVNQALDFATKSTERTSNSWNWYVRAQAEARKGDMTSAVASGTKSAEIGLADENDHYYEDHKEEINAAIQGWAARLN